MPTTHVLLGAALLALLLLIALLHRRYHLLQYLFFCRFPILLALAFFVFPLVAIWTPAEALLANLFVLTPPQLFVVTWLAIVAAWVVTSAAELVVSGIESYFDLSFYREQTPRPPSGTWRKRFLVARPILYALIATPFVLALLIRSEGAPWARGLAVLAGIGLAGLIRLLALVLRRSISGLLLTVRSLARRRSAPGPRPRWLERVGSSSVVAGIGAPLRELRDSVSDAFGRLDERVVRERRPLGLLSLTLAIYLVGGWVLQPRRFSVLAEQTPALVYLLFIVVLLGWILPFVSFYLDKHRVSPVLALIALSAIFYLFSDSDHYYPIQQHGEERRPAATVPFGPRQAVRAWARRNPESRQMVVVTASGGGITASLWTARVLTALRDDPWAGESFGRSVTLISSVSGGGLGAMYYVDGFDAAGAPSGDDLPEIVNAAGVSSLEAAAWGLAYPDFWRAFAAGLVRDKQRDRAWAQEQRWKRFLADEQVTLAGWRAGIMEGWRPTQIFNATITESGERLLLTPVDPPGAGADGEAAWRARTFGEIYPGMDLPVVTAARLSATFPYVAPIARASLDGRPVEPGYHVADGGYFDNFGVVTAIDWLRDALPVYAGELKRDRLLILQIRTSSLERPAPARGRGWVYAAFGPQVTLMRVRTATQVSRNDLEIALLRESWQAKGVEIESVVFELGDTGPLSWRLSAEERGAIDEAWSREENREALRRVREFLAAGPHPVQE